MAKTVRRVLRIGAVEVRPGQRLTIDLPVARLHTHTEMTMPVHVIRGRRSGPRLFVSAVIHGDEINGVEIIRRLLKLRMLEQLRGTLIAVPVVNVFGFINRSRYLPDRRDLNRSFPGSDKGSLAARQADLFMQEIVANASYGIDLHTGSNHRENLPQIRAHMDDPEIARLARAFGAPVIIDANLRDGSLRQAAVEVGVPTLLYEAGEALRFNDLAIRTGLRGVVSVMRAIGMLPAGRRGGTRFEPVVAGSTSWVRAPESGILRTAKPLGGWVADDELLAVVSDPFGEIRVEVRAPGRGIIIGRVKLPLVNEGEALFHLAQFESPETVDATLRAFNDELEPDADQDLVL